MLKTVTMKDIAMKLGVSTVTVSKALTDKEGVGDELRATIKEVAKQMGYRYTIGAKTQKTGKSYNIGIILESHYVDVQNDAFYMKMYQNIIKILAKSNYSGIMELITQEMMKEAIMPNILVENKVDGIIVLGQIKSEYLKMVRDSEIPIVYLDFYDRQMEVDSIITDSVYGTYMLTNYIVSNGHTKIAFVGSIHATASILDRFLGYYRSLLVNNIPFREDYVISDRGDDGLFIELDLPEDMPTAFVCNCDELAYILMEKLKAKGYRIPEDISVVGFDNYTFAGYSSPRLTTVEVNVEAMAQTAVETLIKRILGEKYIQGRRVISGNLIIRDSVADISKHQ